MAGGQRCGNADRHSGYLMRSKIAQNAISGRLYGCLVSGYLNDTRHASKQRIMQNTRNGGI